MDDRHFSYITKLNPKKTTEVSDSKWSGEDEKRTSLQTDNSVDSRTTLMFGVPRKPGFCAVQFPSRWNKSYITFVSGLPAARGLPRGMRKDSVASPNTSKKTRTVG
jgi:hypothetical protein